MENSKIISVDWLPTTNPLVRPIRERLSLVLAYAFSRRAIYECVDRHFTQGEFKHLYDALEYSQETARRAMVEVAAFTRLVDDEQDWSAGFGNIPIGKLMLRNGKQKNLLLREFTNKVLHASGFGWEFSDPDDPKFLCIGDDKEKWIRAEVSAVGLMRICAMTAG